MKEAFVSQIPLGEFGLPVDIAEVAAFLASSRFSEFETNPLLYLETNLEILGPNTSLQPASMSTEA